MTSSQALVFEHKLAELQSSIKYQHKLSYGQRFDTVMINVTRHKKRKCLENMTGSGNGNRK